MKFFKYDYPRFRNNKFLHLLVVNLRYIIGLGFLPSGMVKVLNKPFTRVENVGVFYDFLDALFATGLYYNMIGLMQVLAAVLLITQRFATFGSALFLPIIFNITVLTISTIGSLTPLVALLMLLGILFLLFWDYYKWINIFSADNSLRKIPLNNNFPTYNKIQMWTGVSLILLPALLFSIGFPKTALIFLGLILITGNLISEWQQPVLRPLYSRVFLKSTSEIDPEKL